jgi:hypothetical protein
MTWLLRATLWKATDLMRRERMKNLVREFDEGISGLRPKPASYA